jgi:hypothetical protein
MTEEQIETIAKIAHSANMYYCFSIGDWSQVMWDYAPPWQRDSAIEGVRAFIRNPNITAKETHQSWVGHKIADGWVYGEVKCPMKKTHPCLVPYEDLPLEQQLKDLIFRSIVSGLVEVFNEKPSGEEQSKVQ